MSEMAAEVHFVPFGQSASPQAGSSMPASIEILMDVPLRVTVELGRAQLSVRQILELQSGAVVELDRLAGEAVDVLVNDKLMARGEVVVVDGNYGVRIQEVMSRRERLQESRKYLLPINRS